MKSIKVALVLLMIVLFSEIVVNTTYAKYAGSTAGSVIAKVARFGAIELKEHEAELIDGEYVLTTKEISAGSKTGNKYEKVIPGVAINKDPYITVDGIFEVSYALYIKIVEVNVPNAVTYNVTDKWEFVKEEKISNNQIAKIYKYKDEKNTGEIIPLKEKIAILKDNKLYVGKSLQINGVFYLKFSAWIQQIN